MATLVPSPVLAQNAQNPSNRVPEAQLAAEPSYDSSWSELGLPELGRVSHGVMLNAETFAVADGATGSIYFVDVSDGLLVTDEPVQPRWQPPFLGRLSDDLLVAWRGRGNSINVHTSVGQLVDSIPWRHEGFGGPRLAGVLPDRTPILEKRGQQVSIPGVPAYGDHTAGDGVVRYEVESAAGRVVVAEAKVTDRVNVTVPLASGIAFSTERMIFGERLSTAQSGPHLVIAPSGASSASAYDRAGALAYTIPFPGARIPVSNQIVTAQRYRRIADLRESGVSGSKMERDSAFAAHFGKDYVPVNTDSLALLQIPAKDTAPQIDRMLADPTGRIWFRLTAMPDDTHTRWCAWDTSRRRYAFWLTLQRRDSPLAAFGDRMLLLRKDGDHQPRLLVMPFTVPDAAGRPDRSIHSPCE